MPRYRLTIEYDGSRYCGWQRQENGLAVQQVIEQAGQALSSAKAETAAAGRTDAGVHALAMTAHIDLAKEFDADTVRDGLNFHMRAEAVSILAAQTVTDKFHARFSCMARSYLYRILPRRSPPAIRAGKVWHVPYALDAGAMHDAVQALIGVHDFSTFRAALCQAKSPVKTLTSARVESHDDEIWCHFHAPSFLHNQVRSMVGTIERVGTGRWTKDDVVNALNAKDRRACGPVAAAMGLYFEKAYYPED